jgi:hypothetical protein
MYIPDTFMGIFRRNEVNTTDYINIMSMKSAKWGTDEWGNERK